MPEEEKKDEEKKPLHGWDWVLSTEGMSKIAATVAFIVSQIVLLTNSFRGVEKADAAAIKAETAVVVADETKKVATDTNERVREVHEDVTEVKRIGDRVLMNQKKPKQD